MQSFSFRDDEKPYLELIHGKRVPKMSPKRIHGQLEWRLAAWLDAWANGRGEVAVEWRCTLAGEKKPTSLVPDVAYMSHERLPLDLPHEERECPRIAPDIVVEIWSPGDSARVLREKIALYLGHGARIVIVLYPEQREIAFHHAGFETKIPAHGAVRVPGYDDLALDADALFRAV